jgi:acylphosphatase
MEKAYQIQVFGRVQGVGFRYFTQRKAQETDVKGFAKNMPDGSVFIEAEGKVQDLELFIQWIKKGPSWAMVTQFNITELPPAGYENFSIH